MSVTATRPTLFTSFFVVLALLLSSSPAFAKKSPLRKLKGDIIISKKRFPSRFDTDKAMYKYMRKVNTHEVSAKESGDWEFEYMAFLGKPVATLQAAVTFYDVTTPGTQQLVDTFTFYPSKKDEKILNGYARLAKDKFAPNRKYLMVFSRGYGQKALARTQVVLRK